jgi:3'-5' exoribonuclease
MGIFEPEDIVKVRGTVTIWKDSEQLKIERIRQANETDEVDMAKIVPCSPQDPEVAFEILWRETESFRDQDLKRLVQYLMKAHKREMLYYPAAVKLHHATRGGFLEHTLNVVSMGKAVAARYPGLDGELIVAGAILHDIGKLAELDTGKLGIATAYTAEG